MREVFVNDDVGNKNLFSFFENSFPPARKPHLKTLTKNRKIQENMPAKIHPNLPNHNIF
jgi:hypothetical protein